MPFALFRLFKPKGGRQSEISDAEAHYKRGNRLRVMNQMADALASYDKAIAIHPGYANAFCNRGVVLERLGRLVEAADSYARALQLNPNDSIALYNRGSVLNALGRRDEALGSYNEAIRIQPDYAESYCNRGLLLAELGDWNAALASYDTAIRLRPSLAQAHFNRGSLLQKRKQLPEALASYEAAIVADPGYAEAYCNRGLVQMEARNFHDALRSFDEAIRLRSDFAEPYCNRALVLAELDRVDLAIRDFDTAIALRPDYPEAYHGRGTSLLNRKDFQGAISDYARTLELKPDFRFMPGMFRHIKMCVCDWSDLDADLSRIAEGIEAGATVSPPFPLLALTDAPRLHHKAALIWAREECPASATLPPLDPHPPADRIRLGYFSADFRDHAVAVLMAGLFESHDRSKFDVTAFAFGPDTRDSMRERLEKAFDRFVDVREISDEATATLARSLSIDIAIDLGGYTGHSRTKIFAYRAAPIQISYIGYLGTMGAPYMDYLIADPTIVPADERQHYSEKIIYLPSYQVNDSQRLIGQRAFSREELGIPAAGFVFCCFNSNYKILPATFAIWMRILQRVEGSILFLYADNPMAGQNLRHEAERHGVDSRRIIFGGRLATQDYLARFRCMDLFLDTLPYNAGTTASDALRADLPVLTCAGRAFAGRMAASLLSAVGIPELITSTTQQYEELAVRLATNPDELALIREKLARNRKSTLLFDTASFTRSLECAYADVHRRNQLGLPPDHVFVTTDRWEASTALATTAFQGGRYDEAVRLCDEILAENPDHAVAHYKRANALNALGQGQLALAGYDRAIECNPRYAEAYCNRGTVLEHLGQLPEALYSYDKAVALKPDDFLTYYNRGSVLRSLRRFNDALDSYDRATSLKGDYCEAHINRGHVLQQLERHEAAVASYDRAIELNPTFPEAFASRAFSLINLKRNQDAIASFDRAIAMKPDYRYLLGMRRYAKMAICDWNQLTEDLQAIARGLIDGKPVSHPFPILALFDSPHLHRQAAAIWAREEHAAVEVPGVRAIRKQRDKIRIGYFSADFRHHPVSLLSAELFETHDRSQFEVTGFAFGPPANDAMGARLAAAFDRFEDVRDRTDLDVAMLARHHAIDIAVDLGGYTDHSRTKIFAFRAAAVQISYIGYLGTMGAPYMDYMVADRTIIPVADPEHYSEKIIHLPSYQVNDSRRFCAPRSFSREELGIPAAGFVFCCFNSNYKIMPATFSAWMRILQRVTGSVLFLYAESATAGQNLLREAVQHGVDSRRIILGTRLAMPEYLSRYRTMDLFLDTLPYNAGATASDALWAGLPVLTCMGQSFASRVAASLLNALDLPELITSNPGQYEDLAVRLGTNPDVMASIRERLARNRHAAPLFDTARFTRNLETAYAAIHRRSQQGLPPEHVDVRELIEGR